MALGTWASAPSKNTNGKTYEAAKEQAENAVAAAEKWMSGSSPSFEASKKITGNLSKAFEALEPFAKDEPEAAKLRVKIYNDVMKRLQKASMEAGKRKDGRA